jgi:hypothetical protein
MNVLDAAYALGHDYAGGAHALGPRLGMTGKMLANKLNPNDTNHKLTLDEAQRMQALTGDHRILHAMADELGYVAIPAPTICDEDVNHAMARMCSEFSDYMRKASDSMADGRVTTNERKGLERELSELIASATHLQSALIGKTGKAR